MVQARWREPTSSVDWGHSTVQPKQGALVAGFGLQTTRIPTKHAEWSLHTCTWNIATGPHYAMCGESLVLSV